ncbi:retinol dehydrogenase 14-like [Phlebotomus argentipes]|uniref:retinol dehydrogenase 14-like n=1 Tax=Phlebotomus argentipes TaxID=94469 RepID=UPI002892C579|nr:retinol dehydrogenase 14-like [Phlebotomus argentipes]
MLRTVVRRTLMVLNVLWTIALAMPRRFLAPVKKYTQGGQFRKTHLMLEDKVVVITGGESAQEIAVNLARREAKIIIGMKDASEKGHEIIDEIIDRTGNTNIYVHDLNLASFDSVRKFVDHFYKTETQLDILINCAEDFQGGQNEDGIEWAMIHNHYGHFLITHLLMKALKKSPSGRIVVLASKLHKFARKLTLERCEMSAASAYMKSKLANVIFTRCLAKKLTNTNVTVNCYHEGYTANRILPNCIVKRVNPYILEYFFKSPRSAAQTALYLAMDPDLEGVSGRFFSDCEEIEPSDEAKRDSLAEWFWKKSLQMAEISEKESL